MRVLIHRRVRRAALIAIAGVLAVGGIAYATIPDANGVIHGCRNDQSGELRVIESGDCRPSESALDWVQSSGHEVFLNVPFTPAVEITAVGPAARQHVMTLDLPPGGWHMTTSIVAEKSSGGGILDCVTFTSSSFATAVLRAAMGTEPGSSRHAALAGTGLADLPSGGQAELRCRQRAGATGANPVIETADIAAVRIGAVTQGVGS